MIDYLDRSAIYHFIGIGGIGMSAISEVLINLGFKVTGSDIHKSYITDKLEDLGAIIFTGHDEKYVANASFVIYSSAITEENPEYLFAQKNKIPLVKRSEMLLELMKLKRGIAVGGTHGKTTTTGILATLLNIEPFKASYIIGGVVKNLRGHSLLGEGEFLVAEADESDGSFIELTPEVSIVTNIDDDHMGYYQTAENLEKNFLKFINRVPFYGFCILNGDDQRVKNLLKDVRRRYFTFGIDNPHVDFKGDILKNEHGKCYFSVTYKNIKTNFQINLSGKHNVYNAIGAIATAYKLGYDWSLLESALPLFTGVGRRLELLYKKDKICIYDDYAHHPTEIKAVISSQANQKKTVVVFEPHRYSRTLEKWNDFIDCFKQADEVFILPIYSASEEKIKGISSENLVKEIKKKNINTHFIKKIDEIGQYLDFKNEEFTLLSLGAGSISRAIRIFISELEK